MDAAIRRAVSEVRAPGSALMIPAMPHIRAERPLVYGTVGNVPRLLRVGVTAALSAGLAAALYAGGPGAALTFLVGIVVVVTAARMLATQGDQGFVVASLLIAFGVRATFAMLLNVALFAAGRGGALFLDDAGYVQLASDLARAWRGVALEPSFDPSLYHNYVRAAAALFAVVQDFGRLLMVAQQSRSGR